MSATLYYNNVERTKNNKSLLDDIENYSLEMNKQIFTLKSPLGDKDYHYDYSDAFIMASPGHKLVFVDYGNDEDAFEDFIEDFIEDIGFISDKYRYKNRIGRPKRWRKDTIMQIYTDGEALDAQDLFAQSALEDKDTTKVVELLISLLTGSINDIDRVGNSEPEHLLDRLKAKIQLFDGDQTRFIYQNLNQKEITIQGLSGTGKTELLLHKLKELYVEDSNTKIIFTCHNKILAGDIKSRIPEFFDFMKVEEQIRWNERLWCVHAWGSARDKNSGAYAYIANHYGLSFQSYNPANTFEAVCNDTLAKISDELLEARGPAFDYMLIDESQDFDDSFLNLCRRVTRNNIYIAGDIFQGIFDTRIISEIEPDFLLSKCYRTDPRTLMFAHAAGMGLFESPKLRWLDDKEWNVCGYNFNKYEDGRTYEFSREPLKRFEDLETSGYDSIRIVRFGKDNSLSSNIESILTSLIEEHPTIHPDDIGIIFIENNQSTYDYADRLEQLIPRKFGWDVNKAYESKSKIDDAILISNRNNVKGLEFPFVIVVASNIQSTRGYRNALYTMISRSFLRTYLLTRDKEDDQLLDALEAGLQEIVEHGTMTITAPSDKEKQEIRTRITLKEEYKSYYDFIEAIFDEVGVLPIFRETLSSSVQSIIGDKFDIEEAREIVRFNYEKLAGGDK